MQFLIDDENIEKQFQQILIEVKLMKNGPVVDSMKQKGIAYKTNWGVSVVQLKELSKKYDHSQLLSLKLWNKQWRETMILATMLGEPGKVNEEQMDYWTKSFENTEIAEHTVANLWVKTPYAFAKAIEWCRGKKHVVRFTGIQLMGRLAMVDKKAIDEMFTPFLEEMIPLSKDPKLTHVLYRSLTHLGVRSKQLNKLCLEFVEELKGSGISYSIKLAGLVNDELASEYVQERVNNL